MQNSNKADGSDLYRSRPLPAELLAPAGSLEAFRAAMAAGADAVYLGGRLFGARAYAENADDTELRTAIDEAHLQGKRLYLTVNTLLTQQEMDGRLYDYLKPIYEAGLDAAIVQDLGVFSFLHREFPDLPLHVSTQMTVTGVRGARMMEEAGARRIVLARELSLKEISRITRETGLEIECFAHGALCYGYSGQCLFSGMIGGRSGNRGRCAQACRLPYEVRDGETMLTRGPQPVLNLKDLCTLDRLPQMLEAGIYSFKLEGRMKSPAYTYGVTQVYRRYLDLALQHLQGKAAYRVEDSDRQLLRSLFDRGGSTDGYLSRHNGADMIALRGRPEGRIPDDLTRRLAQESADGPSIRRPVDLSVRLALGEPAKLTGTDVLTGQAVSAEGAAVQPASSHPLSREDVEKQLRKTGATVFAARSVTQDRTGEPFLPVRELNEMRRSVLEQLREKVLSAYRRTAHHIGGAAEMAEPESDGVKASAVRPLWTVRVTDLSLLDVVLARPAVSRVEIEWDAAEAGARARAAAAVRAAGREAWLCLPRILRSDAESKLDQELSGPGRDRWDGLVVRDPEGLAFAQRFRSADDGAALSVISDASLYIWNTGAASFLRARTDEMTLPAELAQVHMEEMLRAGRYRLHPQIDVYGRTPLMISAGCLQKTCGACRRRPGWLVMKDRRGFELPVRLCCGIGSDCYNIIYNAVPTSLHSDADRRRIEALRPSAMRICLTDESRDQAGLVLDRFLSEDREEAVKAVRPNSFTRGRFLRGVE